jgi:hypothetical protein
MRHTNRPWVGLAGLMLIGLSCGLPLSGAAAEPAAASTTDVVSGAWQHHNVTFSYYGVTARFTCDGLEDHVRQILLHLGARKDLTVYANGCPGPINTPSNSAFVHADFYALAPAAGADGSDRVMARWTALEVTPRRPGFMGDGDCELIQGMKDIITKNFSLRDVEYRTSCFPHSISMDGFAVKGQALKALPLNPNAAKG